MQDFGCMLYFTRDLSYIASSMHDLSLGFVQSRFSLLIWTKAGWVEPKQGGIFWFSWTKI